MSKTIPDRWIPYTACGKVIEGTRIVCFKVPLRKGVQEHKQAIKEIWDIKTLLQKLPNLGAVVDLTNTSRYYNPGELREAGILHKKILMPGRIIPPEPKVIQFMDTIDEFLGKDCDMVIGVHCTHGLNRTGYMVCRYMRDRLGIPAGDAIQRFEKARGYKIERENYIADLLGKKPPPPDVGKKQTLIQPLHNQTRDIPKPMRDPRSMQYRSPLEQYDDSSDHYQGQSHGHRNRYNYNPYSRNRNGDRQRNNNTGNTSTSGRSNSRWDMSGTSHRPR